MTEEQEKQIKKLTEERDRYRAAFDEVVSYLDAEIVNYLDGKYGEQGVRND